MKASSLVIIFLATLSLTACFPNRMIHNILEDQVSRGRMYHEILKNDLYRAQLIDSLRTNRHTRPFVNLGGQSNSSVKDRDQDNR
jgi:hypothetical protein